MRKPSKDSLIKKMKIIVDTREQLPYRYPNRIEQALPWGDYSIEYDGMEYYKQIVVERKSRVSELYSATGKERGRFERELEKLRGVMFKWVVCEFDFLALVNKQPPGLLPATAVYGTVISWHVKYNVPFIFCGNRNNAYSFVYKLFYNFTKHRILNYE